MITAHPVPAVYRQPLIGRPDPRFRRALTIAGSVGGVFLLIVLLVPRPAPVEKEVEQLPERLARLILDEPAPNPPPATTAPKSRVEVETPPVPKETVPEAKPRTPEPAPRAERRAPRARRPEVAPDRGTAGREKATTEVAERLASVTDDVDETLKSLAAVLPAAETSNESREAPTRRRGGRVRAGRDRADTGTAAARTIARGAAGGGTALEAGTVDLGTMGDFDLAGVEGDASAATAGSAAPTTSGDRSLEALMSVVRRYAAGIRFCYDTALESDGSLRGKMVFRITVAADGSVAGVTVAEDTLGSADVRSCALTQIRGWRFGKAARASVFDAPFVFRPAG